MSSTASMAKSSFLVRRSMIGSEPPRAAAAGAARARRQGGDALESNPGHRCDHQLGDAVAAADGDGLAAKIGEDDADLAAIIRIDGAGAVENGEAVIERQAG